MSENLLDTADNKDWLSEYVGDGKKYQSPADLAKAYYNADNHIKILEKRMDSLRDDYLKEREERLAAAKFEDLVAKLDQKNIKPDLHDSTNTPVVNEVRKPTIDLEELENRFDQRLRKYEVEKKERENYEKVKVKLTEQLGDKYQDVLRDRIRDLGLSEDDLNALAKKSPTAFFRTLGLEEKEVLREQFQAPPRSNNTFTPKVQSKHKKWSEWKEMRKSNPKMFYDPKIAKQMDIDSQALGEAFFDTD